MIRICIGVFLLAAAMLAQESPAPNVRMVLPVGIRSEKVHMIYGLRQAGGNYQRQVASMPAGVSFFEIAVRTNRFKALVWAPGCKIKEFDVPVEKANIELYYACDPLKTITLRGRVKSVDVVGPMTLSVDYAGMIACRWADATTLVRFYSCSGLDIKGVATANVGPDGSFEIGLPDFDNDPIVSHASRDFYFWLGGTMGMPFLVPESSPANTFKVAGSYPSEVIFVPLVQNSSQQLH
jgi:hypothetical protein